ncbi:acyl-CoA-binding protein [uncultured Eudoraea sp.]|jgi:acyl-CoA-binding protein|uniref:acyl-CoA-binding protein n=1 Tax=uncultured Eudoraea sp. TaxID=1035614 RepID=UPI00260B8B22|nr:acyl-CoA-binding protein [uncultured Eudoraea sp.]
MKSDKLYSEFLEAVQLVNDYKKPLPADLLLKLYAYYKIANKNYNNPGSKTPLINAFKANALIQAQNIDRKEAMDLYVNLVQKEIVNKK